MEHCKCGQRLIGGAARCLDCVGRELLNAVGIDRYRRDPVIYKLVGAALDNARDALLARQTSIELRDEYEPGRRLPWEDDALTAALKLRELRADTENDK